MTEDRVSRARRIWQRWLTAFGVLAAATIFFLPLHSDWHIVSTGPAPGTSPVTTICLVVSAAGTALAGVGAVISGLAARSAVRIAAFQAAAGTPPPAGLPAVPPEQGDAAGGPAGDQ